MDGAATLRVWMAERDVTTKQLAAKLSCSPNAVTNWRRRRSKPLQAQREALERLSDGDVPAPVWGAEEMPGG